MRRIKNEKKLLKEIAAKGGVLAVPVFANGVERMGFEVDKRLCKEYNNRSEDVCIGGKSFRVRSQGEKKLAMYLEMLKLSGHIKDWAFEQTTFYFPDKLHPVITYLVDFDVLNIDGTFEYYEFKGLFDSNMRRKLKLLGEYRPEVRLTLVFNKKADARKVSKKMASFCKRVCILTAKGLIDYDFGY
jgi:hypothetical protein